MKKRALSAAPLRIILMLWVASLACSNPIQNYFSAQASNRDTATATMFTATPTNTSTRRPTRTSTPSVTRTQTPSETLTLAPTDTPLPTDTLERSLETPPPGGKASTSPTGPSVLQPNRFLETAGLTKFSYFPPAGWKMVPASGPNLTGWTPPTTSPTSNSALVFNVEKSEKSAADAAKDMMDTLTSGSGVKIISQAKFVNDAGLDAYKFVAVASSQGLSLQYAVYFFQKRGFLVEGAFVRFLDKDKGLDAVVDQCLRTVKYE